jgi:DNA polymerase I-like protein with 3'-5' exonuclease and polymerase domains
MLTYTPNANSIEQIGLYPPPEGTVTVVAPQKPQYRSRVKKNFPEGTALKTPRKRSKTPQVKKDHSLRGMFRMLLSALDIEQVKRGWMAQCSFRTIASDDELNCWINEVLQDRSAWVAPYAGATPCPVVAVDTETTGLDTRILVHQEQSRDEEGHDVSTPVYVVKIELAGVSLSIDGMRGIYIPVNHEDAANVSREALNYHLQRLFDQSHLVFYNAKFDREVLRLTAGIVFRPYPHFEDVQVLYFNVDPKATLEGATYSGTSGGLKALAKQHLGLDQISLSTIGKVLADWCPRSQSSECSCTEDERRMVKHTQRMQYVPFTWIPPAIALWYAAADAIATWQLWNRFHLEAQSRHNVHSIDGQLIDSLTWIERQRFQIAVDPHRRLVDWFVREMASQRENLRRIALRDGWEEKTDENGNISEDTRFDVDKKHLPELLFGKKRLEVVKRSKKTGAPSVDREALAELMKRHPGDEFLEALAEYKRYVALHPENLRYDQQDKSARIHLKQCVVAGGRLAASGGKFELDGGAGVNIQAVKKVQGNWWLKGRVLEPDRVAEEDVEPHTEEELPGFCFKDGKQAPGILKNHIANLLGYTICLIPGCKTCKEKFGILIERGRLDANQVVNVRALFIASPGWTFLSTDYSNVEMRVAANCSGEPEFINEFLHGSGDFHSLTASKVFAEFNDPRTSMQERKLLRALAKIINFALLYGGTRFTILENMRKMRPEITMEETTAMVDAYWRGVPVYRKWCDNQVALVRSEMISTTDTGRVVNFQSAMDAEHIKKPTQEQVRFYWDYDKVRKRLRNAEECNDIETVVEIKHATDLALADESRAVRNTQDYNHFTSKIERVAVNVPLQGLAGDFMRMAIIRLCTWAVMREPVVQSVLHLHSSVHDELDYTVKNEYLPFIVPRITRAMKLRAMHDQRKWPVPIEADTEYGSSWDVIHHLTGDADHTPAGWTRVEGMEEYLPAEYSLDTVESLVRAIASERPSAIAEANLWAKQTLHSRALEAMHSAFFEKHKKTKQEQPLTDPVRIRRQVFAALQLDECYRIDETPDGDTALLETLEQFEERSGLTPANRGFMPAGGYLGALPLTGVRRPAPKLLGPAAPTPDLPQRHLWPLDLPSPSSS